MRASARIWAGLFVLAGWGATGCGDALDLGGNGSGTGGNGSFEQCSLDPAGSVPACQACGATGDRCSAPDEVNCCCSRGVATGAPSVWQCFANAGCCPSEAPSVGSPCNCTDAPTCTYCGDVGATTLTCGPNGTWISAQTPSNC